MRTGRNKRKSSTRPGPCGYFSFDTKTIKQGARRLATDVARCSRAAHEATRRARGGRRRRLVSSEGRWLDRIRGRGVAGLVDELLLLGDGGGALDGLVLLLELAHVLVHRGDAAAVEVGEVALRAERADDAEGGGEEHERVDEREEDGEEDEDAELEEEDDLRAEHGQRGRDGRDGAREDRGARVPERVADFLEAVGRLGADVRVGEMDRVVDREADDDDDEDRLERAEAPAEDLDPAEDDGADDADRRRRERRDDPVERRDVEDEPREEEREDHVRDARRDELGRDVPALRRGHVDHDLELVLRLGVVVVHPVVPLGRHAQAEHVVRLGRPERRLDLDVVHRHARVAAVVVGDAEDVVFPPLLVVPRLGARLEPRRELLGQVLVLRRALVERLVGDAARLLEADLVGDGKVPDAVAVVDEKVGRVEPEVVDDVARLGVLPVVERERVGLDVERVEARPARRPRRAVGLERELARRRVDGHRRVLPVAERVEHRLDAVRRLDRRRRPAVGRVVERARVGLGELEVDAVLDVDLEPRARRVRELLGRADELDLGRRGVEVERLVPLRVPRDLLLEVLRPHAVERERVAVVEAEEDVHGERRRRLGEPLVVEHGELVEVGLLGQELVLDEGRRGEHRREGEEDDPRADHAAEHEEALRDDEVRVRRLEELGQALLGVLALFVLVVVVLLVRRRLALLGIFDDGLLLLVGGFVVSARWRADGSGLFGLLGRRRRRGGRRAVRSERSQLGRELGDARRPPVLAVHEVLVVDEDDAREERDDGHVVDRDEERREDAEGDDADEGRAEVREEGEDRRRRGDAHRDGGVRVDVRHAVRDGLVVVRRRGVPRVEVDEDVVGANAEDDEDDQVLHD
mmetsp:Transcript_8463/g.34826  ORF Transcript_8463/g.34826 Transcript_8463/m.34826 type:complete len:867 (-) Transcript_8463:1453-4053(-)